MAEQNTKQDWVGDIKKGGSVMKPGDIKVNGFYEYKKGTLLEEYFLNPHFKPNKEESKELDAFFDKISKVKIVKTK